MTAGRTLGLLVALAAGSWVASEFAGRRPLLDPVDEPFPVDRTEVGQATARLAFNLRTLTSSSGTADYTAPLRNPFQFGTPPPPSVPAGMPARHSLSQTARPLPSNAPPERPAMQLSGVAEDPGPDGPMRRAVIATANELFVVAAGDVVLGRFRVARIDPEAVELEDQRGGPRTILTLR